MTNKFDNNTTPLGLMSEEDRNELRELHKKGVKLEYWVADNWLPVTRSNLWSSSYAYRTVPQPKTKPSIDWSHVHEDYNWMATDEGGTTYLFESKPLLEETIWSDPIAEAIAAEVFKTFTKGTCDFRYSLVKRQEGETE